jgi:hypothetical protein
MSLRIVELFGFPAGSKGLEEAAHTFKCPFIAQTCRKTLNDGTISGVCTLAAKNDTTNVACCPIRLYANKFEALKRVAKQAFDPKLPFFFGSLPRDKYPCVVAIGKDFGREIRVPNRAGGTFSVDWFLVHLGDNKSLLEFVAVEVQTIDTTGNYRKERKELLGGNTDPIRSKAGFNWENVNKRILPQLIYKGHVLRLERKCKKGLFFILPTAVNRRIQDRVGNSLMKYEPQPGSITFHTYSLCNDSEPTGPLTLIFDGSMTTTVDQLALAFSSPRDLPTPGVVEESLVRAITSI